MLAFVAGVAFKVEIVPVEALKIADDSIQGQYNEKQSLICLRNDLGPQITRERLMHEILHPLCEAAGVSLSDENTNDEHERLARQLFAFLADEKNSEILKCIIDGADLEKEF